MRAGGKVRRLGMLLLYGSPAFYCDVSQAWRLAPRRRLWVALAGVRVNITVGAAAAVNAAMLPPGPFRQLLSGMTVFNLLLSLLNLCPFVKFDGYVGLAGLLDHPNLRTKAMAAARDLIGRVIYGGRRPVERPTERMAPGWVLYGFGCLLVTPAAVGWALLNYEPVLLGTLGTVGAVLLLGMLGYLLTIPLRALMRAMRTAIASGVPMWRRLLGSAALSAATWGLLAAVPVPVHPTTVYVTDAHGAVLVVVPRGTDPSRIGDITLQRAGMLWHPRVASGHACGPARDVPVDPGAGSPILLGRTVAVPPVRRLAVPVCLTSGRAEASGYATLSTGHVSARRWLYLTFVKPAIDRL